MASKFFCRLRLKSPRPQCLRRATWDLCQRPFHSTPYLHSSSILNLSGLSVSRESRFLSKERGIPRTEFSPHLELIRSSEVDSLASKDTPLSSSSSPKPEAGLWHFHKTSQKIQRLKDALEHARITNAESEAALEALRIRYKRRENEAGILAVVTILLTLGLLYPGKVQQVLYPLQKQSTSLWQWLSSQAEEPVPDQPKPLGSLWGGSSKKIKDASDLASNRTKTNPSSSPRYIWSKLFWARPD